VAGQDQCLDRPDRTAPASRRSLAIAVAPPLRSAFEPGARILALHQQREPGAVGGIPHSRQLPLPLVRRVPEPLLAVAVTRRLPINDPGPRHARNETPSAAPQRAMLVQASPYGVSGAFSKAMQKTIDQPLQETIDQPLTVPAATGPLVGSAVRAAQA